MFLPGAPESNRCPSNKLAQGRRDCGRAITNIIPGERVHPLPKDDANIIVTPRGGLNISKVGPKVLSEVIWNARRIDSAKRDSDNKKT
ncbi:hypothetical protein MTO96_034004 [Rhipicephalus appendiculatus]